MTREEYDALLAQKKATSDRLDEFSRHISQILTGIGLGNDGKAEITSIEDGVADIYYLRRAGHGSCCGDDWESTNWESTKIPAHWLFGGDWRAEHAKQKADEERLDADKKAADAERERLEQERRDKEEFDRLKAKFEGA